MDKSRDDDRCRLIEDDDELVAASRLFDRLLRPGDVDRSLVTDRALVRRRLATDAESSPPPLECSRANDFECRF